MPSQEGVHRCEDVGPFPQEPLLFCWLPPLPALRGEALATYIKSSGASGPDAGPCLLLLPPRPCQGEGARSDSVECLGDFCPKLSQEQVLTLW